MSNTVAYQSRTEAVGLFQSAEDLQSAVDALLSNGFDRIDLSVLANEDAVAEKFGEQYVSVRQLEDKPNVPTTAFVPKESIGDAEGAVIGGFLYVPALAGAAAVVASGGTLAAAIAATAIAGGLGAGLGAILAYLIGDNYARQINAHIEHGGLLLWVRTRDKEHESRAVSLLKANGAADAHIHLLPALD